MNVDAGRPASTRVAIEWGLAFAVVAGIVYSAWHFYAYSHFPQPFFFDISDPLMDFYNVAYWGYRSTKYSDWYALYPPLSFVYLWFITKESCYNHDAAVARDCDPGARYVLYAFFLLNVVLLYLAFRRRERATALPRTIAVGLGLPALYGLERGNLIIPCFTAFILYFGGLVAREGRRLWMLALAINFKPYLLVAVIPRGLFRHFRWLAVLGVITCAVYALTYAFVGMGSPLEIVRNAMTFTMKEEEEFWSSAYYSTSFAPLLRMVEKSLVLRDFVDSRPVDYAAAIVKALIKGGVFSSLLVFGAAAINRRGNLSLAALAIGCMLVVSESMGSYSQVFLFFLLLLCRLEGFAGGLALVLVYLLCIPYDYIVFPIGRELYFESWWADYRPIEGEFGIAVGQLLRPGLIIGLLYCLVWINGRQVLPGATRTALDWIAGVRRKRPEVAATKAP